MVAFADLVVGDVVRFTVDREQLELRLDQEIRLNIEGGGIQTRFDIHRPLALATSMLEQVQLPGKKPVIWFAWGMFQKPLENDALGSQLTFQHANKPYPLREGSRRQLSIGGSVIVQQLYDMPGNKILLAERLTPKLGMPSDYYYRLLTLAETDIQRI